MPHVDMLINSVPGEECRIAIVQDGILEELYHERASAESQVGNIYKGRVINVEPSIQAAFVDFGRERNGFLHISDLHPMYFPGSAKDEAERVGMRTPRRERPPIQKCLHRGQEVLVQVLKSGIGSKGPTLTTYLSIPGRFLVMMPNMERMGVSRKIEDDELRRKMRQMLDELNPPKEFGFIIRTAGIDRTKLELKRDLAYLQRLWKTIDRRMQQVEMGELYTESNLVIRTIRDVFTNEIGRIIVDHPVAAKRAADFLAIASPRSTSQVFLYKDPIPLFDRFDIERQIENIHGKTVPLPSGGSLVIESTEALVAIDVNSGRMRDNRDAETTAYKTNIEACDEICRQLRLRDLGGVVVNDLIDMRDSKHRRALEQQFRDNLKRDRARTRVLAISQFGILEMTRQRMRPGITSSVYGTCTHCSGTGKAKTPDSVVLDVMRRLAVVLSRQDVARVELVVSPDVAFQLLNRRRASLVALEAQSGKNVMVRVNSSAAVDFLSVLGFDSRGGSLDVGEVTAPGEPTLERVSSESPQDLDEGMEEVEAARAGAPQRRRGRRGHPAEVRKPAPVAAADQGSQPNGAPPEAGRNEQEGPAGPGEGAPHAPAEAAPGKRPDMAAESAVVGAAPLGRRRRRRGRGRGRQQQGQAVVPGAASEQPAPAVTPQKTTAVTGANGEGHKTAGKRRRRRGGRGRRQAVPVMTVKPAQVGPQPVTARVAMSGPAGGPAAGSRGYHNRGPGSEREPTKP